VECERREKVQQGGKIFIAKTQGAARKAATEGSETAKDTKNTKGNRYEERRANGPREWNSVNAKPPSSVFVFIIREMGSSISYLRKTAKS
jgi:hypothetical protein